MPKSELKKSQPDYLWEKGCCSWLSAFSLKTFTPDARTLLPWNPTDDNHSSSIISPSVIANIAVSDHLATNAGWAQWSLATSAAELIKQRGCQSTEALQQAGPSSGNLWRMVPLTFQWTFVSQISNKTASWEFEHRSEHLLTYLWEIIKTEHAFAFPQLETM